MSLLEVLIIFSSLSFLAYGIAYFTSPHMKAEFVRFGLGRLGPFIAVLEILGAIGLLVGFFSPHILGISSGGLAILMLAGVAVRLKMKDGMLATLPALFYMILNAYIFYETLQLFWNKDATGLLL